MYPGLQIHIGGSLSSRVRHLAKKLQSTQPDRAEIKEEKYDLNSWLGQCIKSIIIFPRRI